MLNIVIQHVAMHNKLKLCGLHHLSDGFFAYKKQVDAILYIEMSYLSIRVDIGHFQRNTKELSHLIEDMMGRFGKYHKPIIITNRADKQCHIMQIVNNIPFRGGYSYFNEVSNSVFVYRADRKRKNRVFTGILSGCIIYTHSMFMMGQSPINLNALESNVHPHNIEVDKHENRKLIFTCDKNTGRVYVKIEPPIFSTRVTCYYIGIVHKDVYMTETSYNSYIYGDTWCYGWDDRLYTLLHTMSFREFFNNNKLDIFIQETHNLFDKQATKIQRAWRRAISNPVYKVCRTRLHREFSDCLLVSG